MSSQDSSGVLIRSKKWCPRWKVIMLAITPCLWDVSWSATFQSLPDLLPMAPDQTCGPQKHSGRTTHNTRWGNQSWDAEHRHSCLCAITFSSQMCIYISDQYWEFPQSGNQLRCHKNLKSIFCSHSKLSALDTLSLSVSDLSSILTPTPLLINP